MTAADVAASVNGTYRSMVFYLPGIHELKERLTVPSMEYPSVEDEPHIQKAILDNLIARTSSGGM
jgi:hypothetical protein